MYVYFKANTTNILSCNERRWFWATWVPGLVALGEGQKIGVSQILSLDDPSPRTISYVGLTTENQPCEWDIPNMPGMYAKPVIQQGIQNIDYCQVEEHGAFKNLRSNFNCQRSH